MAGGVGSIADKYSVTGIRFQGCSRRARSSPTMHALLFCLFVFEVKPYLAVVIISINLAMIAFNFSVGVKRHETLTRTLPLKILGRRWIKLGNHLKTNNFIYRAANSIKPVC